MSAQAEVIDMTARAAQQNWRVTAPREACSCGGYYEIHGGDLPGHQIQVCHRDTRGHLLCVRVLDPWVAMVNHGRFADPLRMARESLDAAIHGGNA